MDLFIRYSESMGSKLYYKELTNRVDSDISDIDEIRGKISDEI